MKVIGKTCVRNSVFSEHPITGSIISDLPLCDEFHLLIAQSDDNTVTNRTQVHRQYA